MKKTACIILFSWLIALGCHEEDTDNRILTFEDFEKITMDMKYDQIVAMVGKPKRDIGSGIHIYVYELSDQTEVCIGYTDHIEYIYHKK